MSNYDDHTEKVCDGMFADLNSARLDEAVRNLKTLEDQTRNHIIDDQNKIIEAQNKIIKIQTDEIIRLRK